MRLVAVVIGLGQIIEIKVLAANGACALGRFARWREREMIIKGRGDGVHSPFQAGARFVSQPLTPGCPGQRCAHLTRRSARVMH